MSKRHRAEGDQQQYFGTALGEVLAQHSKGHHDDLGLAELVYGQIHQEMLCLGTHRYHFC